MRRTSLLLAAVLVLAACGQDDPPVVTGTPPSPSAVDGCPERYAADDAEPWVPAAPTTETPGRLVPDADPVEALVCRYGQSSRLEGEVVLRTGLDRVRTDLLVPARVEGAERICTLVGGGVVPHLLRLRYADGQLWLSAVQEPNRCQAAGNGEFVSSAYLGELLADAYGSATWPQADPDPCGRERSGRAGQERALAPAGWTSLVVCGEDGSRREVAPERAQQVASLLGQLETRPGADACQGTPTSTDRLVLTYATGPPVEVRWTPACEPSLRNGSLSAAPTSAQTELLGVLLG